MDNAQQGFKMSSYILRKTNARVSDIRAASNSDSDTIEIALLVHYQHSSDQHSNLYQKTDPPLQSWRISFKEG